jgi:hypothetical protein
VERTVRRVPLAQTAIDRATRRGFALSPTQLVMWSDGQQSHLRILTLADHENVGDQPLQPGKVVQGTIGGPSGAKTIGIGARRGRGL